jgi:hypothetical protein
MLTNVKIFLDDSDGFLRFGKKGRDLQIIVFAELPEYGEDENSTLCLACRKRNRARMGTIIEVYFLKRIKIKIDISDCKYTKRK